VIIPLSESLSVAFAWAPRQLCTPKQEKSVFQLAQIISAGISSYYFEWNLQKSGVFDLLFLITKKESFNFLAHLKGQQSLDEQPQWRSIIRFLELWNSHRSPIIAAIPHIWLAFDFSEKERRFNPPNIHFCLDRILSNRSESPLPASTVTKRQMRSITERLFPNFLASNSADVLRQVSACFSLFPADGEILNLSIMQARQPQTVKFNMTLPRSALIPFLARIGWPGDRTMVGAFLDDFCRHEKRIKCNILMNSAILNRIELELDSTAAHAVDSRRERTFELLCKRNIASKSICSAMKEWPGYFWQPVNNGKWPAKIKRWLDIKMCIDENKNMTAKAYLGFYPFFSII
jgi:hypothetical protein